MLIYVTRLADAELKRAYEYSETHATSSPIQLAHLIELPQERSDIHNIYRRNIG